MKIFNLKPDEVFQNLGSGMDVYRFNFNTEETQNLRWMPIDNALKEIRNANNIFFIVDTESEV